MVRAPGPGSRSRSRWPADARRRLVHAAPRRQGRSRRPQRRGQDLAAAGCSAGETPAAAGVVLRGERVGYLPQDPRRTAPASTPPALSHVLSGEGLDVVAQRLEKLRGAGRRGSVGAQRAPASPTRRRSSSALGGYAAESEVRRIAAGLGLPHDRLDLPIDALSGGERRRVELARILFARQRPPAARRADQPPRRRRQAVADGVPAHLPRRAARRQPRPRAARPGHHPRAAPRRGRARRVPGHLLAVPRPRARPTRSAAPKLASRQDAEIQRLSTLADSMRGQTAKRARLAEGPRPPGRARSPPTGSRRSKKERKLSVRLPDPPRPGRGRARGRRPREGVRRATPVFEDVSFDVGRGERLLDPRPQRRGQDDACCGSSSASSTRRLRRGRASVTASSMGYYAQEHEAASPGRSMLDHIRERPRRSDSRSAAARRCSACSGSSGEMAFQDVGDALRRREDEARARDARRRPPQPPAARRADEQPRPAVAARDRRGASRVEGRDGVREPRHRVRRRARAATRAAHARRHPRLLVRRPARPRRAGLTGADRRRRFGAP